MRRSKYSHHKSPRGMHATGSFCSLKPSAKLRLAATSYGDPLVLRNSECGRNLLRVCFEWAICNADFYCEEAVYNRFCLCLGGKVVSPSSHIPLSVAPRDIERQMTSLYTKLKLLNKTGQWNILLPCCSKLIYFLLWTLCSHSPY